MIVGALATVVGGSKLIAALPPRLLDDGFPQTGNWHELKLSTARYLILPATVNNEPFPAVLDSGTSRSVIQDNLALELRLRYFGATLASPLTRDVTGSLYQVDNLSLEIGNFRHFDVASYDLASIEEMISREIPFIIGQDILRKIAVEIEFRNDRARFITRDAARASDYTKLNLEGVDRSFPSLPIRLEQKVHDRAIVDIGSNVPLSMSRDYAEQCGLLRDRPVSTTMTVGVEGASLSQIFCVRQARVGPYTLREVPVCVVENWFLTEPMNLGWPFFAAFDMIVDLGGTALRLHPDPTLIDQPFPKDRSGLGTIRLPDHLRVQHVAFNSPAWHAGIREGDDIISINRRPVDATYPPPGEHQGTKPVGTIIELGLTDGRDVAVKLADYF